MKSELGNFLNAAANSLQNAAENAQAVRQQQIMTPESVEVAKIKAANQMEVTKMSMGMLKKVIILSIVAAVLLGIGALAFGVYSMNKVDSMHKESQMSNERMMNDAMNRLMW